MSASNARHRLWATARQLRALRARGAPANRFDAFGGPSLGFEDVATAPTWIHFEAQSLARYARLVGAAGVARLWQSSIDGEVLRNAVAAIGEPALDKLLNLPADSLPSPSTVVAAEGGAEALAHLGGAMLLALLPPKNGAAPLLRAILPGAPAPHSDAGAARLAFAAATLLFVSERGSA